MAIPRFVIAKREEIQRIATEHCARNVRLFGSFVRGEAGEKSDVDFLVEVGRQTSSWFPAGLILDLQGLLGRKVDVVTEASLHPLLRERVLREAVPL
jgi:predicted nucleotidyltransferase